MKFRSVKKRPGKKRKMMLYIDECIIERIEGVKPPEITTQEAIRQILASFLDDQDVLEGF